MLALAGGAKNTVSFDVHLVIDYLPRVSSITHEGIFYEHYFDVGSEDESLFSCDWSHAASKDPISGQMEYYVGCGMRGKLDGDGIKRHGRPPVQLAIVLDISGSMNDSFRPEEQKNKLDVAKDCVMTLLDNLQPTDAFGLVAFDDKLEVVQQMVNVCDLDAGAFKTKLLQLKPRNSTDMVLGMRGGAQLLNDFARPPPSSPAPKSASSSWSIGNLVSSIFHSKSKSGAVQASVPASSPAASPAASPTPAVGVSKRIMFLTDAEPTAGSDEAEPLMALMRRQYEEDKIAVSFVGLGVDFRVELVDSISRVQGCNYFTVNSGPEFKKLMDEDFDYVITPNCFNVSIRLGAEHSDPSTAVRVERVYGSPGHETPQDGVLFEMQSGMPSSKDERGYTKGAMILMKLAPPSSPSAPRKQQLQLMVDYDDVDGKHYSTIDTLNVEFTEEAERFSNTAIRKAILLTRYVNGVKWWLADHTGQAEPRATVSPSAGIPPAPVVDPASEHCAAHTFMRVSPHYKAMLARLLDHIEREVEHLVDAGEDDDDEPQQLPGVARHLVSLIGFASAREIMAALPTLCTDDEVVAGLGADALQARCEAALKAEDLSGRREAFETEIKSRLLNALRTRLSSFDKEHLRGIIDRGGSSSGGEERDAFLAQMTDFARARPDQDWAAWQRIAESEIQNILNPPAPRRVGMMGALYC